MPFLQYAINQMLAIDTLLLQIQRAYRTCGQLLAANAAIRQQI